MKTEHKFDENLKCHFRWRTEESHFDNEETMNNFIAEIMPDDWGVYLVDGTYAEATTSAGNNIAIHAGGDGDSFNHLVTAELLQS